MSDRITSFLKESTKQLKKMRDTVNRLKAEQEEERKRRKKIDHKREKKAPSAKHQDITVHFSIASVAKATLAVIGLVVLANFFSEIAPILLVFFVSILFAAALDPTVDALEKRGIPRAVSVLVIFLLLLIMLGFFVSQLIPLVAVQLIELAKGLSGMVAKLSEGDPDFFFGEQLQALMNQVFQEVDQDLIVGQLKETLESLGTQLQSVAENTFGAIKGLFNGVFNFALVLVLTFFLVVDERGVDEFFISLFPSKHAKYIINKMEAIKHKVGHWLRGQIILMFLMFGLSLAGFLIIGVDYALTLAMMTGIAELIPVVGPVLAGLPAMLVAFNESPWLVLWVMGLIFLLQQIEGNILVPLVMKKAVCLSPIVVILAMLIGYETLGILGMIIAIPVTTTLSIFVADYTAKEK